ncbi:MAG: ACT domain-containing protein [Clostridia bacterium]|nr:ACT domain-containing protein [Clostridia bacterium]
MRAIVTVIGTDRVGIIASICILLSGMNVNILDINQTVMQEFFTMTMLVDLSACTAPFAELAEQLSKKGEEMALNIRIQREDIFTAMHTL